MQGALGGEIAWPRVGLRQLSGMLIMVFARTHLQARPGRNLLFASETELFLGRSWHAQQVWKCQCVHSDFCIGPEVSWSGWWQ